MRRTLPALLCPIGLLICTSAEAQTQVRNFNLNCGLIGKFAQYPQHYQHCRSQLSCIDPRTCPPEMVDQRKEDQLSAQNPQAELPGSDGLSVGVGVSVQGNVNAGGINVGASANAQGNAGSGGADIGADAKGSIGIGGQ